MADDFEDDDKPHQFFRLIGGPHDGCELRVPLDLEDVPSEIILRHTRYQPYRDSIYVAAPMASFGVVSFTAESFERPTRRYVYQGVSETTVQLREAQRQIEQQHKEIIGLQEQLRKAKTTKRSPKQ